MQHTYLQSIVVGQPGFSLQIMNPVVPSKRASARELNKNRHLDCRFANFGLIPGEQCCC